MLAHFRFTSTISQAARIDCNAPEHFALPKNQYRKNAQKQTIESMASKNDFLITKCIAIVLELFYISAASN